MLTQKYRPKRFNEVFGQDLAVEVLRSIIKKPDDAPRSLILHGDYGCGKTTCARILAKAINCDDPSREREPCGVCNTCKSFGVFSPYFQEYDSSDMGGIDTVRSLKDEMFQVVAKNKWRIIVLDEAHMCSRQAQGALHKILEEMPTNLFFLFCTTELDKMISTIRSRCIEIPFKTAGVASLRESLERVINLEGLSVPEHIVERIVLHSKGHFRDAIMSLDLFNKVENETTFLSMLKSAELEIINLLLMAKSGDKGNFQKLAGEITGCILEGVRSDFYLVLDNAIRLFVTEELETVYREPYEALVASYGQDLFKILKYVSAPWVASVFQSDHALQAFLWSLFYAFAERSGPSPASSTLMTRARKHKVDGH